MTAQDPGGASARARQLALGVELNAARRLDNFVVGPNAACVASLSALARGESSGNAYLTGPAGSGKTHLLQACCALAASCGARVAFVPMGECIELDPGLLTGLESAALVCVDDVDRAAGDARWERALFRLYNDADAAGARMVFAGRNGPGVVTLADLRSRLTAALLLRLAPPDDAQRRRVLRRRASDLGFELGDDVLGYILSRQPRDLGRLAALVESLDRYALAVQRRVTVALVREYLEQAAAGS